MGKVIANLIIAFFTGQASFWLGLLTIVSFEKGMLLWGLGFLLLSIVPVLLFIFSCANLIALAGVSNEEK